MKESENQESSRLVFIVQQNRLAGASEQECHRVDKTSLNKNKKYTPYLSIHSSDSPCLSACPSSVTSSSDPVQRMRCPP